MSKKARSLALALVAAVASAAGGAPPTIDDLLGLDAIGAAVISPDGRWVAFTKTTADFEENAYLSQIWIAPTAGGEAYALTRNAKSSSRVGWSPDAQWVSFTSSRVEDKPQIFVIHPDGGEAVRLTNVENGVRSYEWSPDGKRIAFSATIVDKDAKDSRQEHLGDFAVVRREYEHLHLHVLDVEEALETPQGGDLLTTGEELSVGSFAWSPGSERIAFDATANPDLVQGHTADIFVLTVEGQKLDRIVESEGPDTSPRWSPDGAQLAFATSGGREHYYPLNTELAVVDAQGGEARILTADFDEDARILEWKEGGLYFQALQKTASHLFRLNPTTREIDRISAPANLSAASYSLSSDGGQVAFSADRPDGLREVFVADVVAGGFSGKVLTSSSSQLLELTMGTREVISWPSRDGATIEGILIKPQDFDPLRRYPLLVRIHGGPTGIDRPTISGDRRYYPVDTWVGRGALVLKVNYRGSAGYGEQFRTLNVRNLGVGDAWDVLSGVDHLVQKGWVDEDRIGCMGWSQGGYISAFLTTSSDRFAAISVGAGISNWATYYYNTDITPFTIHYLGDDPAADPEIYTKTSPMTHINEARTPTLIQHGELDRRVPIPNAYELRQGLEDREVPVEMIVYKGFGHGISKPREMRAVMRHNLEWFNHYLWGDALPDFASPALPAAAKDLKED